MTTVHRLKRVSGFVTLAAIFTCSHVWGEPAKEKGKPNFLSGQPAPAGVERQLGDNLAVTKFSNRNLIIYETQGGATLFALQVRHDLKPGAVKPRDVLLLVDTAASQVRGSLAVARELVEALVASARPEDRLSIWTVNTPAATQNLSRGFAAAGSDKIKEAVRLLNQEIALGANDLKSALDKTIGSFENIDGRQRVIVFLGSGKSLLNPISNAERGELCAKMVAKEIGFYPVPLGTNLEPNNLHGLASGTGGLLVRLGVEEQAPGTVKRLTESFETPVFYVQKFKLTPSAPAALQGGDAGGVEFYPTKLPPIRSDAPTLVVGKLKAPLGEGDFEYTLEGKVNGRDSRVTLKEQMPLAELDNFFLVGMVEQWKEAGRKEFPSPFRADRALAMSFERTRLARDEFVAQGHWAVELDRLDVAAQMFAHARKIDPADAEAVAGAKIVEKLRAGLLTKDKLREALGKPEDPGIRIRKEGKVVRIDRDRMDRLVALAQNEQKAGALAPAPAEAPLDREPLLQLQKQRQAVEEQRITGIVNEAERQARRILLSDPDAAHDLLRRTLATIRDNNDLTPQTRQALSNRLENALRTVDIQGVRIKRELDERMRLLAEAQTKIAAAAEQARVEEQIQRRVQAFNQLMNQGRVEEAYKEAYVMQQDMIARGLEVKPTMIAGYDMGLFATHQREQSEIRRASEERYLLAMIQVDKSHIPFPDEPPLSFPPAQTWKEITKLRKGLWDSSGLGDQDGTKKSQEIKEKLSKPVTLEQGIGANTQLKDALDFLAERYDLTLIIDTRAFEAIGIAKVEEQPVELPKMIGVGLSTVLRLLLAKVKGDAYTGTYLIRRDFIEITTTYNAVAEKSIRAYPVADLVIPVPNSVNTQALNQSLNVYGQFQNSQNPFQFMPQGGFGGFGGGFGAGGMGAPNQAQMGGFQQGFNVNFQGGGVGNNQFGNLGGQFGLQGTDTSRQLLELVVKVVAPGEWYPLGAAPNAPGAPPGGAAMPAGLAGQNPLDLETTVPREMWNSIDYYSPARALIVRGSSRIHTSLEGGLLSPRPGGAPPAAAAPGIPPNGVIVGGPKSKTPDKTAVAKDNKTSPPAKDAKNTTVAKDAKKAPEPPDPKTVWQEALAKITKNPRADHNGLVIAVADFLVEHRKFDYAAEFLKAALREGINPRPWMYEALGVALQLSGGSPEEVERAQVSAVDLEPQDARGYLRAAKGMAELKRFGQAVAFCRQAALMEPNLADPYANGLVYAQEGKDALAMAWAASNLLRQDWPADNEELHNRAQGRLGDFAKQLDSEQRRGDAERMLTAVQQVKRRDLVIQLEWQGEADFDLKVKEPIGTACSYLQRQTPGGGILLGDDLANLARKNSDGTVSGSKTYVAAEGFSGDYEISVERIWGRSLGAKVSVKVIQYQGTPQERLDLKTLLIDRGAAKVAISLANGRRTTTAQVPPPAAIQQPERDDKPNNPDRVLNRLRALSDPVLMETSGLRGSVGGGFVARPQTRNPVRSASISDRTAFSTKVASYVNNALDITAQTTVLPDKQEIRVKFNPVFQTAGKGQPALNNPLIPGGN